VEKLTNVTVFKFPSDWNITHSENHWANTATQMDYVKNIILPGCI